MKGSRSLEDERQAILARMRASREEYRTLLGGAPRTQLHVPDEYSQEMPPVGSGFAHNPARTPLHAQSLHYEDDHPQVYGDDLHGDGSGHVVSSYRETHSAYMPPAGGIDPRALAYTALDTTVSFVKRHPLLCIGAVVAIAAIGPRRVLRGTVKGGTVVTALTLRNPKNIGMLTRLISTVADIVQRGRARHPP